MTTQSPYESGYEDFPYDEEAERRIQETSGALGVSEQELLDLFYAARSEIQNPTVPVEGIYDEYTFADALRTINPEANEDQLEVLSAAFVAGGYINHVRVEVPRQFRYDQSVTRNARAQEDFYDSLPENWADAFRNGLGASALDTNLIEYQYELFDNLDRLSRGETISVTPRVGEARELTPEELTQGYEAPPTIQRQFVNTDDYLNFETAQLRELYPDPDFADFNDPKALQRYANLAKRSIYLEYAGPEAFELLDNDFRQAQAYRTGRDIGAPGRFGLEQFANFRDSTPPETQQILNKIDPRVSNFGDVASIYPETFGRSRFSFNSDDTETFGISGRDIGEVITDPTNVIPVPIIDDVFRAFARAFGTTLKVPATATQKVASGVFIPATRNTLDVAKEVAAKLSANGLEAIRSLSREVPEIDRVSYRQIEPTELLPNQANREELSGIIGQINPDFEVRFTDEILQDPAGNVVAGITDRNERLIKVSYNVGDPLDTTYHEGLHAALDFLPDTSKRLLRDGFEGGTKGWQEAAADAFNTFARSLDDSTIKNTFTNNTAIGKIFNDILDTYTRLSNFFRQRGYQTAEELFMRIKSGQAYSDAASTPPGIASEVGSRIQLIHPDAEDAALGVANYEVRQLSDIIASHEFNLRVTENPNYPAQYQPRDRTSAISAQQISRIANELKPELLISNSASISDGTPIVTRDGIVLSGNGRTIGLQESLRRGTYAPYREQLLNSAKDFGLDRAAIEKLDNPILVRVSNDPNNYISIAKTANISTVAQLRATESAASTAQNIQPNTILNLANMLVNAQGSNIEKAPRVLDLLDQQGVQEGARPFIRQIIPDVELNQYLDSGSGRLNGAGLNYVSTVLEGAALDLTDPVQRVFFNRFAVGTGDITEALRNLKNGLARSVPKLLQLRAQIKLGQVEAKYDITHYLAGGANWLYEQLADSEFTRRHLFAILNNSDMFANVADQIPVEIYRHIAAGLYLNSRSAPAISRIINHYIVTVQEAKAGLFAALGDDSVLTISSAWQNSFQDTLNPRFKFTDNEQSAYELLTKRAIEASERLPESTPTGSQVPDEITSTADKALDKVALLDDEVVAKYGTTPSRRAETEEVLGPPPTRTSQNEAGITRKDSPRQVAKKTARAIEQGRITRDEGERIQILHNADQEAIEQVQALGATYDRNLPPGTRTPEQIYKSIDDTVVRLTETISTKELDTVQARVNEFWFGITTGLKNPKRFVVQEPFKKVPSDPLGLLQFGEQFARSMGLRQSNATRTVKALFQRADDATGKIRANLKVLGDTINRTAKLQGIDLDDFKVSNKFYAALDAPAEVRSSHIVAMTVPERIVYGLIVKAQRQREKWIMEAFSDLLEPISPNATKRREWEKILRDNFFREDYFARRWADPLDEGRPVIRGTERDRVVRSARAGSLKERVLEGSYEDLVKQGYRPKHVNPIDTWVESTIEVHGTIFQASFLQRLLELGVIRRRPPGRGRQPAFASLDDQVALTNRLPTQRLGLPNSDTFVRGSVPFNNDLINAMRSILPEETGVYRLAVGDDYYITRGADGLLTTLFNIPPTGLGANVLRGTSRLARQLKLIKLGLSLYQVVDLLFHRLPGLEFDTTNIRKSLITYPRTIGTAGSTFISPRLTQKMRRVFSGQDPTELIEWAPGTPDASVIMAHQVPGIRPINLESQIKIDPFTVINEKYARWGNFAEHWADKNGFRRPVGGAVQAGLQFAKTVEKGINLYNRYVSERLFEGATAYIQLRYLQVSGRRQARLAYQRGLSRDQFLTELGIGANRFTSSQQAWDSIASSEVKRMIASIFLFSSESESFLKTGFGGLEGLVRLVGSTPRIAGLPGLNRNSTDALAQQAIAAFIFYAGIANITTMTTSLIQTGEVRLLPLEDYFPIQYNPYAPFKISINRNWLSGELPIETENGNARVDVWGPKDALLRALDPLPFVASRLGQIPRTAIDLGRQEDFFGDPYDEPGEGTLKTFLNLFSPIILDFTTTQERAGPLATFVERFLGFNLNIPGTQKGRDNRAKLWAQEQEVGYDVEGYLDLNYLHQREFSFSPAYTDSTVRVLEDEYSQYDENAGPRLKLDKLVLVGRNVYDSLTSTRNLLTTLFDPLSQYSDEREWSRFSDSLSDSNNARIVNTQYLYNDTFANAEIRASRWSGTRQFCRSGNPRIS